MVQGFQESGQGLLIPLGHDLHLAAGQVAHPSRQPQLPGPAPCPGTEIDALDQAADHAMQCFHALPSQGRLHRSEQPLSLEAVIPVFRDHDVVQDPQIHFSGGPLQSAR